MNYKIALIHGDGIGPEIVNEAKKILDKVCQVYGHTFTYTNVLLGGASIDVHGVPLTDEAIAEAKSSDAVLMGSIGGDAKTSPWYQLEPSKRPEAGLLAIRKALNLFANLRPAYLYDELKAACEAVKESNPDVAPLAATWGSTHYGALNEVYWPYFWGAGASIVDDDGNLTIDTDAGLEATQFLKDMKDEGLLPDTTTSVDDALEPFKNGEAAMTVVASSNLARVDGINWDFSILSGPEDTKTFVASDSLVLFNKCKNKDLAAKLMKYVTSKDVMADFHERVSEQPPITADDTYSGDERFEDLFTNQTDKFQSLPVFKGASSMYDTLYKNLQSMMLGELTPEEVLKNTTEYYDSNLK